MDKIKFELEIPVRASPSMLYQHFATPSGLEEWFADEVNLRGKLISFSWDGSIEEAKLVSKKNNELVKYKWLDGEDDDSYFEFKIHVDKLTKGVSVIITDFAEEDEIEEAKLLWDTQINTLRNAIGA